MQLKNSSPVAMDKRMDLASLFCMIGRHGPAVAVAVIAVVSVVAGFIIYRNVKGKRRKAATGAPDGDGRSPRPLQPEEPRSRGESTDVSDEDLSIKADVDATPSLLKIRNRRAASDKKPYSPPKKDPEPVDEQLRSPLQDSCNVLGNTSKAENVDVKGVLCSQDTTEDTMKAAEEDHDSCLKPAVTCESHEEKVLKSEEDERVTTEEDVSDQTISHEANLQSVFDSPARSEQNAMSQNQDELEDEEIPPETNCMESYMEEPICRTDADIGEENHPDHIDFTKDGANFLQEKEMNNEAQEECIDDQVAALQQEIGLSLFKQTHLPSSQQADGENVLDEMPSIQDGNGQQEPESDLSCGQEGSIEKEMFLSSCDEVHNLSSVMLGHSLPCLTESVEPDMMDALCDSTADAKDQTSTDLQLKYEVEDEMVLDLAIDAVVDGLCLDVPELKDIKGENIDAITAVMPTEESLEHLVFSSISDPDAAVCEKASLTAAVTSTELPHPEELLSFQDQKGDQMQILDLPEVTSAPAPDMTGSIKPPICQIPSLSFDQIELTWSSSGAGEESGISSMTVSPALQDADTECEIIPESVMDLMDCCSGSEEQTGPQIQFFADDDSISVNKDAEVTEPGSLSNLSQKHDGEQMDKSSTGNKDMFGHEDVYNEATSQSAVKDSELQKETVKMDVVESEKKDDEKTEISIMAATMDNNEWITDGNYQVLPWMNLSVPSLTQNAQTDPISTKEHNILPVDASRNADNPPSTGVELTILPRVCDNTENDKKVVAVQPMPQHVNVTFSTHYLTHFPYQKLAITGNQQELGNWKEFIPLERAKDGHWATVVSLPVESHVEWKFVVLDKGEVFRWEECGNRLLDTGYGDDMLVHKLWGLL